MITCNKCKVNFRVNLQQIGEGNIIRCLNCHHEWMIKKIDITKFFPKKQDMRIGLVKNETSNSKIEMSDNQGFQVDIDKEVDTRANNTTSIKNAENDKMHFFDEIESISKDVEAITTDQDLNKINNQYLVSRNHDESHNNINLTKHVLIIVFLLKIILIAFILGIIHIATVSNKLPMLQKFYESINIHPRVTFELVDTNIKTTHIAKGQNDKIAIILKLYIRNNANKSDIISSVKVVIQDETHELLMEVVLEPHIIIKSKIDLPLQVRLPSVDKNATYISVYINNTIQLDRAKLFNLIADELIPSLQDDNQASINN
jgi:predicted Zn finger-like uncharacterized protein